MSDCIFCKIVSGNIPVQIISENDSAILINDKSPMAPHHVLAIVKEHFDNAGELYGLDMMAILANVFTLFDHYVITNNLNKSGYRIIVNSGPDAGQTVKHLHFHLLGGAALKNDFGV
jgi:histidine triad (HIT) family protein